MYTHIYIHICMWTHVHIHTCNIHTQAYMHTHPYAYTQYTQYVFYTTHCHMLLYLHVCAGACVHECMSNLSGIIVLICIMHFSKMALEGELKKLRDHYTQVNNERNQLKRIVDEKDKEIEELINAKNKIVQDNSDSMELMRNQLQQYARDYEEERVAREKFAQQMMKLDKSIKEKDEEIDHLQEQLTKYGGNMVRPDVRRELINKH